MCLNLDWNPRRIFYGWWVVGACFFIALSMGGVVVFGFTAFFEPLANEFSWSYAQISLAASLRGLEMGILAPLVGMLVDRWGPRRLLLGGAIIVSMGLILLSRTTSLGMFYGAFVLVSIGVSACSSTVLMTAVANWFRRKIGIATGVMSCGFACGGLLVPVIVNLIDIYEWRLAITILATGILAVCLPMSLVVRHKPEQYGHLPDGEVNEVVMPDDRLPPVAVAEVNIKVSQALKSRTFWHITVTLLCQMMIISAVVTHVMPYLSSIGVTRAHSSLIAATVPVASISGRLGLGWLGDKFDKRRVMAGALAMISVGLLCFGLASSGALWLLAPFLILFGIGWGGNVTLRASALRQFFGRSNFGAIHGIMMGILMLGNVTGPPLAGWVYDTWNSYQPIWFVFVGLAVAAILVVINTPSVSSTPQPIDET